MGYAVTTLGHTTKCICFNKPQFQYWKHWLITSQKKNHLKHILLVSNFMIILKIISEKPTETYFKTIKSLKRRFRGLSFNEE